MILPDVNLLVYAFNASAPEHPRAVRWWEDVVNGSQVVGVSWPVYLGFIRLLTGRHVVTDPYPASDLFALTDQWWERPNVRLLAPTPETFRIFRQLMEAHSLAGSASTDALIAAHALEHGGRLATNDTEFLRFPTLLVYNPLRP